MTFPKNLEALPHVGVTLNNEVLLTCYFVITNWIEPLVFLLVALMSSFFNHEIRI